VKIKKEIKIVENERKIVRKIEIKKKKKIKKEIKIILTRRKIQLKLHFMFQEIKLVIIIIQLSERRKKKTKQKTFNM